MSDRVSVTRSAVLACNPNRHTMTVQFGEVKIKRKLSIPCDKCGKRKLTRTVEAWQTTNPYNVNKDGKQKSVEEIRAELPAELAKAEAFELKRPHVCGKCSPTEEKVKE